MYPIARPRISSLTGTRFRLFPQSPESGLFSEPETVVIALPPDSIGPGPCDDRVYVADAIGKHVPYGEGIWPSAPPWPGPVRPPVRCGPDGNFDHIPVNSPDFLPAHMYGSIRMVLQIWETYLGRPVQWIEGAEWPRLELVPVVDWDNAHFGPGYMEAGVRRNKLGVPALFCLNFDVMAHEMAHAILFSVVGFPSRTTVTAEYLGFQEGCSDFMALVSALHFMSVVDLTLDETGGNLYVLNTLSRIGETSATEQIRIASNDFKLSDFTGVTYTPDGRWVDPTGQERDAHELSLPLSGALFDILVEFYQDGLVARGIIPPDDDIRGWSRNEIADDYDRLARTYGRKLALHRDAFQQSLIEARDLAGLCLADAMTQLDSDNFDYDDLAACFLAAALARGQEANRQAIVEHFQWRGIDPLAGMGISRVPARSPAFFPDPGASYAERHAAACRRGNHGGAPAGASLAMAVHRVIGHGWRTSEKS
ncbi:MAG TPA: hypothetical protein VEX87_09265 [Skermanella sp.]|jgi:hypothetical protein|nr:hypothetical protein [Skermanella sp.]